MEHRKPSNVRIGVYGVQKKNKTKQKNRKREKEGNGISGNKYKNFPNLMNDVNIKIHNAPIQT